MSEEETFIPLTSHTSFPLLPQHTEPYPPSLPNKESLHHLPHSPTIKQLFPMKTSYKVIFVVCQGGGQSLGAGNQQHLACGNFSVGPDDMVSATDGSLGQEQRWPLVL